METNSHQPCRTVSGKHVQYCHRLYKKWLEEEVVRLTDTSTTIRKLQTMSARLGVPKILVSENATGSTFADFGSFLSRLGIKLARSSPYHPKTNVLAKNQSSSLKTIWAQFRQTHWVSKLSLIGSCLITVSHSTSQQGRHPVNWCSTDVWEPNSIAFDQISMRNCESSKKRRIKMTFSCKGSTLAITSSWKALVKKEKWEPWTVETRTMPTS